MLHQNTIFVYSDGFWHVNIELRSKHLLKVMNTFVKQWINRWAAYLPILINPFWTSLLSNLGYSTLFLQNCNLQKNIAYKLVSHFYFLLYFIIVIIVFRNCLNNRVAIKLVFFAKIVKLILILIKIYLFM